MADHGLTWLIVWGQTGDRERIPGKVRREFMSGRGWGGNAPVCVSVSGLLEGVGRKKPIRGKAVWGEGVRDGGLAGSGGSGSGSVAGAAAASTWSCLRDWRARSRARRVASMRYWSLEKVFECTVAEYPRGYFSGPLNAV